MSARTRRRMARAAARHAAGILPRERAEWGAAMRAEAELIDADRSALGWALGCVWASYLERLNKPVVASVTVARCALAALIGFYVIQRIPIALKTWAVLSGRYAARVDENGVMQPFDPPPFFAVILSMSPWYLFVFCVFNALYLAAAAALALNWRRAAEVYALAFTIQLAGWVVMRFDPLLSRFAAPAFWSDVLMLCALAGAGFAAAAMTNRFPALHFAHSRR